MTRRYTNTTLGHDGVKELESGIWEVVSETPKTLVLRMIEKPKTIWGERGLCNYVKVGERVTVKKDNSGRHHYRSLSDGSFVIYANRDGVPNHFEPIEAAEAA